MTTDAPTGPDAPPPECQSPTDCVTLHGAPPCGMWSCDTGTCAVSCPGCTDNDMDGFGVETTPGACAGPDCDDNDPAVHSDTVTACYSGPAGTMGVGECRAGTATCTAGVWTPCTGSVTPSGEACNNQDDDCNGMVDDNLGTFACGIGACAATVNACTAGGLGMCTPGTPAAADTTCDGVDDDCDGVADEDCGQCVHVSPTGNDALAITSNNVTPFATIQGAIDWAAADATRPRLVCVAAGNACGANAAYNGAVVMSNGISVAGNYEATTWTGCTTSTTTINPGVAIGVSFPATVTAPTALDSFRIVRFLAATTAAVTVDGATSVTLSNLTIPDGPAVTNSYGVNLITGAQATITRSSIFAGLGTGESISVRSVGSTPTIVQNCSMYDAAGHCTAFCGMANQGLRGRFMVGTGVTYGVLLQDSPNAVIQANAICGNQADTGAGIRVGGNGNGILIRGNRINSFGGAIDSHGVWLEDCMGGAPWIVDNDLIAAAGANPMTRADGVRAIGDCHPVIDSNLLITGGGEGNASGVNGVYCGANAAGTASSCVVLGNLDIRGSSNGFPPTAVGVRCDDGGCLRIAGNTINGNGGIDVWGVWLGASATVVQGNRIGGGCGMASSTGVYARDSFARLENNRITGGNCGPGGGSTGTFTGLRVDTTSGGHELDVNANDIFGGGLPNACTSTGLELGVLTAPPSGDVGIYRNNIIHAGVCNTARGVVETDASSDPRFFEHNDIYPTSTPTLYLDENTTALTTPAMIDALTDTTANGTLSADPLFVAPPMDLHIMATSPCNDTGTPTGAPPVDMDGQPRSATTPDIGADEN